MSFATSATPRSRARSKRAAVVLLSSVALAALLAACTPADSASSSSGSSSSRSSSTSNSPLPAAALDTLPANGAANVNPAQPVTVTAQGGWLLAVSVKGDDGSVIKGVLDKDEKTWKSTVALGYGRTYTVTGQTQNTEGLKHLATSKFKTVTPVNQTMPYLNTTGGGSLQNGAAYGVGIVPVVHFDEEVTDRAAAERTLSVTTTPKVTGVWYWQDSQNVHFRPEKYWPSGTKVTVEAKPFGVNVGKGLYGQGNAKVSFTIGHAQVFRVTDNEKIVHVYKDGKIVRNMPTSMGQGGYYQVKTGSISLWTMPGTYTVLDQGNPVVMDSASFGLPRSDPLGYKEDVYWATRISNDGIYMHSAPWSVGAQGNTNTSHGCLNLSPEDAEWVYGFVQVGDPVEVRDTGGPALEQWDNGDWSVPWKDWVKGSALHATTATPVPTPSR